jgi:hypothetical protein
MMTERQNTKLWNRVSHITAIFREKKKPLKIYRMKFEREVYYNHTQFKKAKNYIQNLVDNYKYEEVHQDLLYVNELLNLSPTEYCIYQVSKIVWFFEILRKRSINKMMVDFSKSSEKEYWIMNIENIQHSVACPQNLERFSVKKIVYRDPEYTEAHLSHIIKAAKQDPLKQNPKIQKMTEKLNSIYENVK